jgi:DNA-binding NarL/FixJ family response regulator
MRVMICEDHEAFRVGLTSLLEGMGIQVTGGARDLDQLRTLMRVAVPDAVIIDIRMPPAYADEGIVGAAELRQRHPNLGILVLSAFGEAVYAERLLKIGSGVGYLLKDSVTDVETIQRSLRQVINGENYIDPIVIERLANRKQIQARISGLTPRQRKALMLMAEGLSNAGIASRMNVTEKTVDGYVTTIFDQLDLNRHTTNHHNRRVSAVLATLQAD